jgi:hypothetical protein
MRKISFLKVFLLFFLLIILSSCHKEEEKYAQKLIQTLDKGKVIQTRNAMDQIGYCLNRFMMDHGGYPEADDVSSVVAVLIPQYANDLPRVDAWKNELGYLSDGDHYTLTSSGDDELFHTEDDIIMQDGIHR